MPKKECNQAKVKVDVPENSHYKIKVISENLCKPMSFTSKVILRKIEYRYKDLL